MKCLLKQFKWVFKSYGGGSLQSVLVCWLVWFFIFFGAKFENVLKLLKIVAVFLSYSIFDIALKIYQMFAEIVYWVTGNWCEFYLEETKQALCFKSDGFET